MVKIGSRLQYLLSRSSTHRTFINADLQIQLPASIDAHSISVTRTLKAVYPHFFEARRKYSSKFRAYSSEKSSHKELYCEMHEARRSYQKIKEIHEQLNHAYHELMLPKTK